MKRLFSFMLLAYVVLTVPSDKICGSERSIGKNSSADINIQEIVNQVSTDSIAATIQRLQDFKTRYSYTDSCTKAAEYLYHLLESWGLEVEYDCFEGEKLNDIDFDSTGQYGWACGDLGAICRTADFGSHWEIFDLGLLIDLKGLDALNKDTVWIVGVGTIIHTGDGGKTWEILKYPASSPIRWDKVQFVDAKHGWIVDVEGESVLRTSNGGVSWIEQGNPTDYYQLHSDLCFIDTLNGWTATKGGILKTTDGGKNWLHITIEEMKSFYGVYFTDKNNGWIVGEKGRIYRATDGGDHWNRLTSPEIFGLDLFTVHFINASEGWTAGYLGTLLHTTNGGETWSAIIGVTTNNISQIDFIDSNRGWITGQGGTVLYTENGGITWTPRVINTGYQPWCNVIARIQGTKNPGKKVIISGHYDSIVRQSYLGDPYTPAPGADDNASGISAVLEAARILRNDNFDCTVEFICFTGEEQILIGSRYYAYAQHLQNADIAAVLNFDVIGTNTANNEVNIYHGGNSGPIASLLSETMTTYTNLKSNLIFDDDMSESDGGSFSVFGFPAVNVFQKGRPPNIHTPADSLSNLDLNYLTQIVQTGVASLALLADETYTNVDRNRYVLPVPKTVRLWQNYPNPFNQNTVIRFVLPESGRIRLTIVDLLGREIETLIDENRNPGEYTIEWNTHELPSGIYFYKIQAGDFTDIKKLTLIK